MTTEEIERWTEMQYINNILRAAYSHDSDGVLVAMRQLADWAGATDYVIAIDDTGEGYRYAKLAG